MPQSKLPSYSLGQLLPFRFAPVGVLTRFHRRRHAFLLAVHDLFAPLDQVFRALAKFPRFALRVIAAFVRFRRQVFPRFFARLRRKKYTYHGANPQTRQKKAHLRAGIVITHIAPPKLSLSNSTLA